jgi:hypothetical protein
VHWYAIFKRREKLWRDSQDRRYQIDWVPMRLALLEYDLFGARGELEDMLWEGEREQIESMPGGFRPAW